MRYANPGDIFEMSSNNFVLSCEGSSFLAVCDADDGNSRIKKVKSHIEAGDYFGTLATVLDLLLQERSKLEKRENALIKNLRNDLLFLEKYYKIEKK